MGPVSLSWMDSSSFSPAEKVKIEGMGCNSPKDLVDKIRASEDAARTHLGDDLTAYILKVYAEHDEGKTPPQGKLGAFL